jgi:hypothetical protein
MTETIELSRRVLAEHIGRADAQITVEATPEERAAVAERLLIPAIASLRCVWTLRPGESGMILGQGVLQAKITQTCVVSLDPFDTIVRETFDVHFVVAGRESEEDDPDQPDQLVYDGVAIDVGEATVEELALVLDPYPRKPDAKLSITDSYDGGGAFAALAKLRDLD